MQILPVYFLYLAAGFRVVGGLAYVLATLRGKAQPKATIWLLWGMTPMITFFAELSAGVGTAAIIPLALGISPLLVAAAAFRVDRKLFSIDAFEAFCLSIAVLGVAAWAVTQEPLTAIVLAITADFVSAIPIIRKTIRRPASEYPPTYLISALSMVVALLATETVSFAAFAFPVYVLAINTVIFSLAMRRYGKTPTKRPGKKPRHRHLRTA